MKCIPSEILNQIFDLLLQEDQMECMLVCRLWKDIIEDHSLFRDLRIYSTDSLKSFINKLQDNPVIGRNVNHLACYFENGSTVNMTKLLEPLCNLQTFNCSGPEFGDLLFDKEMNIPWRKSIETFSQKLFDPIIGSVLETDVFPRLTVLDVCNYSSYYDGEEDEEDEEDEDSDDEGDNDNDGDNNDNNDNKDNDDNDYRDDSDFHGDHDDDNYNSGIDDDDDDDDDDNNNNQDDNNSVNNNNNYNHSHNVFLRSLKNAPALKDLSLCYGEFSFDILDALHESLPHLNRLTLKISSFLGGTFYKCTEPAKSITEFNFVSVASGTVQQRIDILRYIKTKYPNLIQLKVDPDFFGNSNSETEQLNDQGWRPLLHHLGSQLNELQVCYELEVQSFLDLLDVSRCQIQTLYLRAVSPLAAFPIIEQSQQALYLKTLVLKQIRPESFNWLKELKVLENLDVIIDEYEEPLHFKFNDIVENCPESLLSLSLTNVKLTVELNSVIQCNVETLKLSHCNLPKKIDWFISRHFPLLSAFTLSNCKFRTKIFDMKALDLQTFCLIQHASNEALTVLVQTYDNFKERWYSTRGVKSYYAFKYQRDGVDPTEYPPVISLPASEIKEKPFLTLYCHTMRQIFLCR